MAPETSDLSKSGVFRWRLISGAALVILLVALCWLDAGAPRPGMYLAPLAVALCAFGAGELLAMFRKRGGGPLGWAIYVGTLLPVLGSCMPVVWPGSGMGPAGWLACGLAVGLMVPLMGEMARFPGAEQSAGKTTVNLALASLSVLYVGGLIGFFIQLRLLTGANDTPLGLTPLLSLILVVKVSDSGQYFVGSRFGKRKLAPVLSPGKTWEGAVGGIGVSALLTATVLTLWFQSLVGIGGWTRALVYCVVLGVVGLVGDLAESLLKRDAGVKDSSTWLPGLGGVLDVLDSLLVTAPVAYVFWVLGLVEC